MEKKILPCGDLKNILPTAAIRMGDGHAVHSCGDCEVEVLLRTLLDKLTLSSIQLPDDSIHVPLGRKTPIGKPGWGSMLSVVDGSLAPVPWEDLDSAMVQEIPLESSGFTFDILKNHLRLLDAVETIPGGEEYVVSDAVAPNSPCRVSNPDVVSECGLSELPCSIHSGDDTEHDAFFVQTCVEEVENAE